MPNLSVRLLVAVVTAALCAALLPSMASAAISDEIIVKRDPGQIGRASCRERV